MGGMSLKATAQLFPPSFPSKWLTERWYCLEIPLVAKQVCPGVVLLRVWAYSDAWRTDRFASKPARSVAGLSSGTGVMQRAGKEKRTCWVWVWECFTQEVRSCNLKVLGTKKASWTEQKTSSCSERGLRGGIFWHAESTSPVSPPTEKMWSDKRKGGEKALFKAIWQRREWRRRHMWERSGSRGEKWSESSHQC